MPSLPPTADRLRLYDRPRDDPQVTPYRRPVHTVGIAGKPGVAVLGISHDGVALTAPVAMTPAKLLAFLGRVAEVAVLTGLAPEQIVDAVADALGVKRTRAVVAPPVVAPVIDRTTATCVDCGEVFPRRSPQGPMPKRCSACVIARGRQAALANYHGKKGVTRPTSITCDGCGAAVPVQPRGRIPTCCATCRAKRYGGMGASG